MPQVCMPSIHTPGFRPVIHIRLYTYENTPILTSSAQKKQEEGIYKFHQNMKAVQFLLQIGFGDAVFFMAMWWWCLLAPWRCNVDFFLRFYHHHWCNCFLNNSWIECALPLSQSKLHIIMCRVSAAKLKLRLNNFLARFIFLLASLGTLYVVMRH